MRSLLPCLLCLVLLGAVVQAQAKSYNTVTNMSQMQTQGKMTLEIFKKIEQATDGRVTLVWHDGGDIVPVPMHINSVSSGAVPTAFTAFAYFGGSLPIANIYSGFPFAPDVEGWYSWLFMGDGLKILQETLDGLNIVALPIMATPPEGAGFFNREITSPESFKGLRFRIGGWGGEVVSHLGAAVSQIPVNELYMAMDRGRIDAMEFSSPAIDVSWGFDKLAKYYYFPGWHQPVGMQWLLVNKKVWDSWSPEDRDAIFNICRMYFISNYYALKQQDVDALGVLQSSATLKVARLPEPVLQALHDAWLKVLADGTAKHPEVKKAYESLMSYTGRTDELNKLQEMSSFKE